MKALLMESTLRGAVPGRMEAVVCLEVSPAS